jgi:hypothetical protein
MRTLFLFSTLAIFLTLPLGAPASARRVADGDATPSSTDLRGPFGRPALAGRQETRTRIDVSKLGPQVGERVPDFKLLDQNGKEQTLQSIMGRRGAMLVFIRSADW